MELILNQYKSLLASCSRFPNTVFKCAPHKYKVLLSAKLQLSDFSMTKYRSFINMLNNKGHGMEPCGIPCLISDHLLQDEPTFVCCLLELTKHSTECFF